MSKTTEELKGSKSDRLMTFSRMNVVTPYWISTILTIYVKCLLH